MKRALPVLALCAPLFLTPFGDAKLTSAAETLPLIDELNITIQQRLQHPLPNALGMSRIMVPPSFGQHYWPIMSDKRDFSPETDRERKAIAALEERQIHAGLYLFGAPILLGDASDSNFRALKGPGALTIGTPRPNRYPALVEADRTTPAARDALPDWNAIYPVAQRAMRSFRDGGKGFEMEFQGWTIAARPAIANQERCVSCHNNAVYRLLPGVSNLLDPMRGMAKLGDPLGGVLYAFRAAKGS